MSKVLAGKVAIVTGASSGIGLATVKLFLESGASVLGVDVSAAPESVPLGETFAFHQVDLTATKAPAEIVAAARSAFSINRIDILVNNAGIMDIFAGAATYTDETWDKVIAVNLTAPTRLMREKSGNIVNVSSKAGISGCSAGVAYTASKHGILGVTKNTAWIYKDDGIRCNAICPGSISTNIANTIDWNTADHAAFNTLKPIMACHINMETGEGLLQPQACAQAILFLASDLSTSMTGIVVPVDNGWSVI
ncbi:short-chain dehydrogenase/reductase SDR [Coprinopsis sp. MPI-PUGE-AT-0042]|nr:short-chain dehydrogenase/reductase SDR [Coprinopsis sp. MPI-PUGE-AT-0042]